MSKNIWRCRCGKRVEVLTDENFGDCGCSDPVYGPEYFYMSKECADMLDEMDKDYDKQHKQLAEAQAEIERLNKKIEARNVAVRIQVAMINDKDKLIEQMREALRLALPETRSTHCEKIILAALAAERGCKMKCKECGSASGEMWGHFDCPLCRTCLAYFEKRIDEICLNVAVKSAAERGEK